MDSRIAVIGAAGQLGNELMRLLGPQAVPLRREQIDITDLPSVREVLHQNSLSAVINTAAYNWVDKAEDEPQAAYAVNALGPRNLAIVCAELQIPLIHVSTDYVYGQASLDGESPMPYSETDAPGPVSAYGGSKLAGEYFVRATAPQHFVVRTCGLYGHAVSAGKGNFVKTMLRVGRERGAVRVVHDQHCTPTAVADLAPALLKLIDSKQFGLYHLTNSGATTWFEFAQTIFKVANLPVTIEPITSQQFVAKAKRPLYSILDCGKAQALGIEMPNWQSAVERYLATL